MTTLKCEGFNGRVSCSLERKPFNFVRIYQITKSFIQKNRIGLSLSPLSECANLPSIQCRVNEEITQNFWRKVEEFLEPGKGLCRLRVDWNWLKTTSCCEIDILEFPHWAPITHCTLYKSGLTASACVTTWGLSVLCYPGVGPLVWLPLCSCSLLFFISGFTRDKNTTNKSMKRQHFFKGW